MLARQARSFPDFDLVALDNMIEGAERALSPLDLAFTYALYDAAVRRWGTLEFLLQRSLTQKFSDLEPKLRGALIGAAAQIVFLDKVPAHAAINHAVEWTKKHIRVGAGSMANAVLRKVAALRPDQAPRRERYAGARDELPLSDGSALVLSENVLPDDPMERLSVATGHPRDLLEHWLSQRSMRDVHALAMHTLMDPPVILNIAHARSSQPFMHSGSIQTHDRPGHAVFTGPAHELETLLSSRDDLWVQDSASSAAIASIADLRPEIVLDLCAGQGTKTRQLAQVFPKARIVATDLDAHRFRTLQESFEGSARVEVLAPADVREKYLAKADLILLDVPCSNTGVLARRPEARYRLNARSLGALVGLQRQIIADSIPLLREAPRGKILYSTCSIESDENALHAQWAERWHGLKASRHQQSQPVGVPGGTRTSYTDGAFSMLLG